MYQKMYEIFLNPKSDDDFTCDWRANNSADTIIVGNVVGRCTNVKVTLIQCLVSAGKGGSHGAFL